MTVSKVQVKYLAQKLKPAREGWAEFANCKGKDVSEFVYDTELPTNKVRKVLEKICEDCPVLKTCRLEAIRNMDIGWWGGMDEQERNIWAVRNIS